MNRSLHVFDHPLIRHKLSILRKKDTPSWLFRTLLKEISLLLVYEITRDLPLREISIETPLETTSAWKLEGKKIVFVPILRAGLGLLEGMLEVIPSARVGHIGLYREPKTLQSVEYYCKFPEDIADREVIVLDPMLATGNSAVAAIHRIKEATPRSIRFVCLLAAPEGVKNFHDEHPDVPIFSAALDRCLNEKGYILPGLGDAGDRLFGTK
jgi:uracil phosphoribosyltransferase